MKFIFSRNCQFRD